MGLKFFVLVFWGVGKVTGPLFPSQYMDPGFMRDCWEVLGVAKVHLTLLVWGGAYWAGPGSSYEKG